MCGIAGIFSSTGISESDQHAICPMTRVLYHRGPDAEGYFKDPHLLLGHRRLSIIDITSGHQPLCNEDRSIWIVFNGEIFNYLELMDDLKKRGHIFKTRSDTEVIVHAYEEFGLNLFNHLNGQFAIALWDSNKQQLLLGRDRIGILPLFYTTTPSGRLLFASEMKSLFCYPEMVPEIDNAGIKQIFTFWSNVPPRTIFKNVNELQPASFAVINRAGEITVKKYWDMTFPNRSDYIRNSIGYYQDRLSELLNDAVTIRLRADVPVAAYLSGGIDSSIISALVKKYHNNDLITFSVAFNDGQFDERSYQMEMVKHLKTDHRIVEADYQTIGDAFSDIIWFTEKPMIRTAPAPLFLLSKLVRQNGIKVVLTGEGSDEFLGGYDIFKENAIRQFWSRNPDSKVRPQLFSRIYPDIVRSSKTNPFWLQFFKKNLTDTLNPYYSHLIRWSNSEYIGNFLNIESDNSGSTMYDELAGYLTANTTQWHPLCKAQYLESKLFLSGYLMSSQGDRMLMGNSVEGRFPFLDHRLIEFAATIPPEFKMMGLSEKHILKKTFAAILPQNIVKRTKQPYRAPIEQCFKQENLASEMLDNATIEEYGYFNPDAVKKLRLKLVEGTGKLSERENMALVAIISMHLVHHYFIKRNWKSFSDELCGKKTQISFLTK
jgi:asparagine synthase (glutamine-hydrolysing)